MFYNGKNNYLIGDDMMKGEGEFYRDMCNPTRDGKCCHHQFNFVFSHNYRQSIYQSINQLINPQIMTRTHSYSIGQSIDNINNYVDSMDAHHSSGIYNKAWCLLSKTPGWDYIKAFQVSLRLS